ncbi:hypothetical protein CC2G_002204 [Coprinopsis cinerea AmutBmut pab1-1]|nr:hypothetical protein CC2G_002204 [Coprinopsis cinerea AmutBmut pab1-1]
MSASYRVSASSKLIKRIQNLFDIIQTASSWTNNDGEKKREELLLASYKVSEQSIKEGFAHERYLGPAIHSWLFIHAQDYVDSPGDIPVDFFVLDHLHSKTPPLLNPDLRKKLEKARRDSLPTLVNAPAPLTKPEEQSGKSKAKVLEAQEQKPAKGKEKSIKVKEEKVTGTSAKQTKEVKVKEEKVVKGKEARDVQTDKGKAKAQAVKAAKEFQVDKGKGKAQQEQALSKSKAGPSKPSTSTKRPPVSSSSSEDDTLPNPHTLKKPSPVPPPKKTKRDPLPDPSLTAMDVDQTPPGDDEGDGQEGYWARLPRPDDIPTGDVAFDLSEVIHNFKRMYSQVNAVKADYDTLLLSSEETRNDVRQLKQQKVDPIQVLSHEQKLDLLNADIRKLTQESMELKAAIGNLTTDGQKIKTLTDDVGKLTKENSELRALIGKLSADLQSLTSSVSNRTDLIFDGVDASSGGHGGYSSVAYDPQYLPFLNNLNAHNQTSSSTSMTD